MTITAYVPITHFQMIHALKSMALCVKILRIWCERAPRLIKSACLPNDRICNYNHNQSNCHLNGARFLESVSLPKWQTNREHLRRCCLSLCSLTLYEHFKKYRALSTFVVIVVIVALSRLFDVTFFLILMFSFFVFCCFIYSHCYDLKLCTCRCQVHFCCISAHFTQT